MTDHIYDSDGTLLERRRVWRKADGTVWYRRWTDDVRLDDREANAAEMAAFQERENEEDVRRHRRRLRRSVEELLATGGNANEVVTCLVGLGLVAPKLAKAAGWVPPGQA
jgi:hypothetical protein